MRRPRPLERLDWYHCDQVISRAKTRISALGAMFVELIPRVRVCEKVSKHSPGAMKRSIMRVARLKNVPRRQKNAERRFTFSLVVAALLSLSHVGKRERRCHQARLLYDLDLSNFFIENSKKGCVSSISDGGSVLKKSTIVK